MKLTKLEIRLQKEESLAHQALAKVIDNEPSPERSEIIGGAVSLTNLLQKLNIPLLID